MRERLYTTNTRNDVDDEKVWDTYTGYLGQGHANAISWTADDYRLMPETVQWIVDDFSDWPVD